AELAREHLGVRRVDGLAARRELAARLAVGAGLAGEDVAVAAAAVGRIALAAAARLVAARRDAEGILLVADVRAVGRDLHSRHGGASQQDQEQEGDVGARNQAHRTSPRSSPGAMPGPSLVSRWTEKARVEANRLRSGY